MSLFQSRPHIIWNFSFDEETPLLTCRTRLRNQTNLATLKDDAMKRFELMFEDTQVQLDINEGTQ